MRNPTESMTKRVRRPFVGRLALFCLLALFGVLLRSPLARAQEGKTASEPDRPVILLTGFEPFGKKKPPNPSWEAIKDLDGKAFHGHRLVARQMRCVWGAPRQHLEEWIAECRPVAVFSFGAGGEHGFDLEIRGVNERGNHADNSGVKPTLTKIVEDGPARYVGFSREKLALQLAEKGYPTRISTSAGGYLCNECLYTLEHFKMNKALTGTVSFCHVPPLEAKIGGKKVTAEYVREFIVDLLTVWHEANEGEKAAAGKGEETKEMKEIREFITRYFRTWSEQDMKGYDACFHQEASIQHIDSRNRISTQMRAEFVQGQADYHKSATHKATEVAESMEITMEAKLARVVVYWKLTAGPRVEYGYDHFTLIKLDGNWKIVNLVFYATPKKM